MYFLYDLTMILHSSSSTQKLRRETTNTNFPLGRDEAGEGREQENATNAKLERTNERKNKNHR